ncbi:MAG: DUF5675 family protein [Clostridium sp.]|nr:DUF5675 family protein [Clostridium sp.]
MNLTLKRLNLTPNYTEGELYVNGVYFCKTLEDTNRDLNKNGQFDNNEKKVYGETCIPYGKYKVILSYSPKFKRELPEILEVPNFQGIRIHRGNKISDTLGCVLCGEKIKNGYLSNSTPYEIKLVELFKQAKSRNEESFIEII